MVNASLARAVNLTRFRTATVSGKDVYLAETSEQRKQGLSDLKVLDKDGMLFVFQQPSFSPFHMANMQMDLTISFYDADGVLIKSKECSKHFRGPIFSPQPYTYVLETPAGIKALEKIGVSGLKAG